MLLFAKIWIGLVIGLIIGAVYLSLGATKFFIVLGLLAFMIVTILAVEALRP